MSVQRDPKLATVRVAISDSAETADFAVVDDIDGTEETACEATAATRFVAISAQPPVRRPSSISRMTAAHRTIGFSSARRELTGADAAALVVGARGEQSHLAARALN